METAIAYKYLEPKPQRKFTKQWGIKGRNIIVWNLAADVLVSGHSAEDVARNFRLPVEAVQEVLDYYAANKEWIDEENDALGREIGLK